MLQAPKKTAAPTPQNNPPLLPPPEPLRSSTASALPNWGQPLSDCTIFFAAHPGPRCRLTRQRAENRVPALESHDQAPSARWSPTWWGRGWGREAGSLCFPSSPPSSRGGSGASRAQPVPGSEGPGCARGAQEIAWPGCRRPRKPLPRSLARRLALQPWLKTHRREHGARSQKLVMSSVQREPHLLFF